MKTYNYSDFENRSTDEIKEDYYRLLNRTAHQGFLCKDPGKNILSKIISILENIPSESFKIHFMKTEVHYDEIRLWMGLCYETDYVHNVSECFLLKKSEEGNVDLSYISTFLKELNAFISQSYRAILIPRLQADEFSLEASVQSWEKEISKIKKESTEVWNYLTNNKQKLCTELLSLLRFKLSKIKALDNRNNSLSAMERIIHHRINLSLPEKGEKVFRGWYTYPFHVSDPDQYKSDLNSDDWSYFVKKEGGYFYLKTKDGKSRRVKHAQRYLPFVKGLEWVTNFIKD